MHLCSGASNAPGFSLQLTVKLMLTRISPLKCALTEFASVNRLERALSNSFDLKSFRFCIYKKVRGSPGVLRSRLVAAFGFVPRYRFRYNRGAAGPVVGFGFLMLEA